MSDDIRWQQRLDSYEKAFNKLNNGIELSKQKELSGLEKNGVIQRFQYTQ